MPSTYIGQERSTGIYQLIGLVYLFTIWPFVLVIGLVGAAIYLVSDLILKLLLDRSVGTGNKASAFWMRLFRWPIDQLKWVVTGDGTFPLLP